MNFKNYQSNFQLIPILAFIIVFSCFVSAGFWQLDRANQKNTLNSSYTLRQAKELINLNQVNELNKKESLLWRRAIVSGDFLNEQNIILDNQIFKHTAGFNVITPFSIQGSEYTVLINRGWQANLISRDLVPLVDIIDNMQNIQGHISNFPVSGINLGSQNVEVFNSSLSRLQRLDLSDLKSLLGLKLLPYMIYLDPLIDRNYVNTFKLPAPDSEKNYGYAFQWFAFAIALLIIFLSLGIKKKNVTK